MGIIHYINHALRFAEETPHVNTRNGESFANYTLWRLETERKVVVDMLKKAGGPAGLSAATKRKFEDPEPMQLAYKTPITAKIVKKDEK